MRFFITIGDRSYPPTRLFESPWSSYTRSLAFFCPQCSEIWARWEREADCSAEHARLMYLYPAYWRAETQSCPNHQWGTWDRDIPGSIIRHNEDILILPRELLIRELFLNAVPTTTETT